MGGKTEEFVNTLENWFDSRMFQVHTVLPGKILSYTGHTERKAKVLPLINPRDWQNDVIELNPIDDVPVIFPSSNSFNFLFPLNPDDYVLLLFSESSLGNYLNSSNSNAVEADDINRFDLGDCIAIPGLWGFKTVPQTEVNDQDFSLIFGESKIKIEANTGYITLEDTLGNKVETSATGIKLTDLSNNTIDMGLASVTINNNLEVLP